jgi:hypothetical protein
MIHDESIHVGEFFRASLKEIGAHFCLHYSTVSGIIDQRPDPFFAFFASRAGFRVLHPPTCTEFATQKRSRPWAAIRQTSLTCIFLRDPGRTRPFPAAPQPVISLSRRRELVPDPRISQNREIFPMPDVPKRHRET